MNAVQRVLTRWPLCAALLAVVANVHLQAAEAQPPLPLVQPQPLRIGMVNAQSGPAAGLGRGMVDGARAVFAEVNTHGGVHGRPLELLAADDGYEPERTTNETLRLVLDEGVLGLLGFVGTPTTQAVLPLVQEFGMPLVGVFSGASSLRSADVKGLFNIRASYDEEAEALVAWLLASGARRIGVVYQFDGFGLAALGATQRALQRRGLTVAAMGHFQRNTVAVNMAAGQMLEAEPDAVVMAGPYAPVTALVKRMRALGLRSQLATVSFVGTEDLVPRLGADGEGLVVSQVVPFPDERTAVGRDCAAVLARHLSVPLEFVNLEGCIAARVLVSALERSGPQPTRASLRLALQGLRDLDLGGLTVDFSAAARPAPLPVYLTQVQAGQVKPIERRP